jgi:hypothetical protein
MPNVWSFTRRPLRASTLEDIKCLMAEHGMFRLEVYSPRAVGEMIPAEQPEIEALIWSLKRLSYRHGGLPQNFRVAGREVGQTHDGFVRGRGTASTE